MNNKCNLSLELLKLSNKLRELSKSIWELVEVSKMFGRLSDEE